jgi:hypothetical protein
MSLAWLRRSSRAVAAIVLLTSLWQLPHRSQDDEFCLPATAETHDESKHVFTSPTAPAHQDHCAICHWVRWMKPVFAATAMAAANSGPDSELAPLTASLRRDPASDRRPARAPPAL